MPDSAEGVFNDLVDRLKADESVVGFFLSGSRGKGFGTAASDYDVVIVAADGARSAVRERYPFRYHPRVDCVVYTLAEFRSYAALGSPSAWDRYSFAHVSVQWDRSGGLQWLVDEKGRLPESDRIGFLREALDSYINSIYRSLKRTARGDRFGARLEAAQSITHLLDVVFGLEGRHAPFPGYLELELEKYPLARLPLSPGKLLELIESVLTADKAAQQETLRLLEPVCRDQGLGDVIDAWADDYRWMVSVTATARDARLAAAAGLGSKAEYAIAVFLPFPGTHWVKVLREKYDPLARAVPAHITLVHPFASGFTSENLERHLREVAATFTPFRVELQGITGHQDEYLFLNLVRGNDELVALRERLYRGPLSGYRDRSRSYLPHVTVGRLSDQSQFLEALRSTHSCNQLATEVVEEIVGYRIESDGRREVVARARLGASVRDG